MINPLITAETLEKKSKEAKDKAFNTFMAQPTIRLLMSKMPETEPEYLETLLREAHSHGWAGASGHTAVSFIEVLMKNEMKRQ